MDHIPEACISAYKLTFHPVYRISLFVHLIVSFFSMIPLIYFIVFKLNKTGFHGNLKFLLGSYFVSVFLLSADFAAISIIEIIIPFFSTHPCDLLIPSRYLKIGNSTVSLFMTLSTFFPISITIERFIAIKTAEKYEKTTIILGPILTLFNVFLDVLIVFLLYRNEKFDDGSISFVFFPKSLAPKMLSFFFILVVFNSINIVCNFLLLRQNNRIRNSTSSLTTKYQRVEVYQSTKFAVLVIFCNFVLFGFYVLGIVLLRYFGSYLMEDPTDLMAFRGAFTTTISLYNLVIGTVASYFNQQIKLKKSNQLAGTVRIEATGSVGAKNYDSAILDIWNSAAISRNN